MARELENPRREANFLHQLGLTLISLNRPKEAFEHFRKSLTISEQIGDKQGQADSLSEIVKLLLGTRQFNKVLECFQGALNIDRELDSPVKVAIDLEHIGLVFEEQGYYKEALIKYQEALQLFQQYGSPQDIAHIERDISRVKRQI